MRRAKEENSPLFSSKKLDTGVTKGEKVGINDFEGIPLDQTNKKSEYVEDVENPLSKPSLNISLESETELNSKGSDCQSNLLKLPLNEVDKSSPLNSNESGCEKKESVTTSEIIMQIPIQDLSKNTCDKQENLQTKKAKSAERLSHRRKLTNLRLSQLIFPKCASTVLNDLKKGCVFTTVEKSSKPRLILVTVKHKDGLMAMGEGSSKAEAKNIAAENAIKKIVLDLILQKESLYRKDMDFQKTGGDEKILMYLPWKELTSLAVYKLFEEWQSQGVRFPEVFLSKLKVPPTISNEGLPFVTDDENPCVVLTQLLPGMAPVEIERQDFPNFHVTMGYVVGGKLYSATGGTKKEAKKKAAIMALKALYGMDFSE